MGLVSIENCTISGNSSNDYGGGIENLGTIASNNSTIANNLVGQDGSDGSGGGIYAGASSYTGLRNTILYGNRSKVGNSYYANDCFGTLTSLHYNLVGTLLYCTLNDQFDDHIGANPLLAPLAYNSGLTLNHAILPGSPAIDSANPAGCLGENGDPLTIDQRGFIRPWDGDGNGVAICDIGSYEYAARKLFFLPLTIK
jgi:hypothetical protein